jgi:GT2 family glycosyltransferase/O-antigen/teichoic acid export membrane protein
MSPVTLTRPLQTRPGRAVLTVGMDVLCADLGDDVAELHRPDGTPLPVAERPALVLVRRRGHPLRVVGVGEGTTAEDLRLPTDHDIPAQAGGPLPSVTVIIPTAGRPEDIRRCALSLHHNTYRPMQVIVVDNNPSDGRTARAIEDVRRQTGLDVEYIAEPRRGSSIARNTGLELARGEIVAFTDDDVLVDPEWTQRIARAFDDPEIACVTGLVMPWQLETEAQVLFERYGGFAKGVQSRVWRKEPGPGDSILHPYACGTFGSGNNMAFRASVLRELGGFDVALGAGSPARAGADIESFLRVLLAGHALRYEPAALVWHKHRRQLPELQRQLNSYGSGLAAIGTKHVLPGTGKPLSLLARIPAALWFLLSSSSYRNRNRQDGYPPALVWAELRGVLAGPWRYAKARWAAARAEGGLSSAQAAMLSSTVLNGLLGIAYWLVAARTYPTAEVGIAAAWVTTLMALSNIGQLNYAGALQRFLPRSGPHARRLILIGHAVSAPASALLGIAIVVFGPQSLTAHHLGLLIALSLPVWALFSLQDAALLGIGRPWWVPAENAAYGVVKLVLLLALAPFGTAFAIAVSWVLPAALAVVVISYGLFTRLAPAVAVEQPMAHAIPAYVLRRFARSDFVGGLFGSLPLWVLPTLVVVMASPRTGAVWAAAVLVASVPDLGATALNSALTVHLARHPAETVAVLRTHTRRMVLLLGPYVLVAFVGAHLLMSAFGESYGGAGTMLLRLLLLGAGVKVAAQTVCAAARAHSEMRLVVAIQAIGGIGGCAAAIALLDLSGVDGAALGLALGWGVAAAAGIPALHRLGPR